MRKIKDFNTDRINNARLAKKRAMFNLLKEITDLTLYSSEFKARSLKNYTSNAVQSKTSWLISEGILKNTTTVIKSEKQGPSPKSYTLLIDVSLLDNSYLDSISTKYSVDM